MDSNLKISVVTVTYNSVSTLEETILSVINQTYDNVEYIIIDGGSTDGTVDIIKKYAEGGSEFSNHNNHVTYWKSEPDRGIYDAMNKGIAVATGDYINFMNSGDRFVETATITNVVNLIKSKAELTNSIFYGDTIYRYSYGNILIHALDVNKIDERLPYCHQSAFVSLKLHKKRPFEISFKYCADYRFAYLSVKQDNIEMSYIPITVAVYEAEYGQSSKYYKDTFKELFLARNEQNSTFFCLRYLIKVNMIMLRHKIKKILPAKIIVKIVSSKHKLRHKN